MNRGARLATILLGCISMHTSFAAGEFSQTIFFGDSLTDSGSFVALGVFPPGTGKFTTNPGPVWSENVANFYGVSAVPAYPLGFEGTNYAVGGSRVTLLPGFPNAVPTNAAPPISTQIDTYLALTGGVAPSSALFTVWAGANDIFVALTTPLPPAYLVTTALQDAAQIMRLRDAGAKYIIVPKIPNLGTTPDGIALGAVASALLTQYSNLYNDTLFQALASNNVNIIPIDTYNLLSEVSANPAPYGLVNVTMPACGAQPSVLCTSANFVVPDADQTYLYADPAHPTTAGHRIISDFVIGTILAPHQISMLPESEVKVRTSHVEMINRQLEHEAWLRSEQGRHLWVALNGQHLGFDDFKGLAATDDTNYGATIGADFRVTPEIILGGALAYGKISPHWSDERGKYSQEDYVATAYGSWRIPSWYLNGTLSYGWIDYETHRQVPLRNFKRKAEGDTRGDNLSLAALGGYDLVFNKLLHGPFIGWQYQHAQVKSFSETGGSIALAFKKQSRSSNIGSTGWHFNYPLSPQLMTFLQVAINHEFNNGEREIRAMSLDYLVGWDSPAYESDRTWVPITAGIGGLLGKMVSWNLAGQYIPQQDGTNAYSVFLSTSVSI